MSLKSYMSVKFSSIGTGYSRSLFLRKYMQVKAFNDADTNPTERRDWKAEMMENRLGYMRVKQMNFQSKVQVQCSLFGTAEMDSYRMIAMISDGA